MRFQDLRAVLAVACAMLLTIPEQAAAQEPPQYKLIIVRGDNAQNNIKKGRATRPVVEVRDRNNNPVAGVAVTFLLPGNGPSGTFVGGGQTATVTTNAQGQASASFTPNSVPGKYNVNVSAGSGAQSVAAQIVMTNVITTAVVTGTTLAIIVGVVAAAGAGAAVALTRNDTPAAPSGLKIGPGTGSVTPPK